MDLYREPKHQKFQVPWRWLICLVVLAGISITYEFVLKVTAQEDHGYYPSALSQLQTARSQLHLYANQHNDTFPTLAELNNNWGVLTQETNVEGRPPLMGEVVYGPYLQVPPKNRMTGSSRVAPPGQSTSRDGWEYDATTGELWLVIPTQDMFDNEAADARDAVVASQP